MSGRRVEHVVYRPDLNFCPLPLGLRSVGRGVFEPDFLTGRYNTKFFHLIWTESGAGEVAADGNRFRVSAGEVTVIPPSGIHSLRVVGAEPWRYFWCTLDGVAAGALLRLFQLPFQPLRIGAPEEAWFAGLEESLEILGGEAERNAGCAAYEFLSRLAGRMEFPGRDGTAEIWKLLPEHPEWNIQELAAESGLSRGTVHRIVRREIGMSAKGYLDSVRLQKARGLLRNGTMPIAEVAHVSGFANANYFSKFFRKKCGMTPSEFRAETHMP